MEPSELKARARAIGLSRGKLAELADLDPATVSRLVNKRTSPILRTLQKATDALEAEERRRRDELIDRHGLPDRETFMVAGTPRRIVRPTKEERAA